MRVITLARAAWLGTVAAANGQHLDVLAHAWDSVLIVEFEAVERDAPAGFRELYPLLGDFLEGVVMEQYRVFGKALSNKMFADYLDGCRERDPDMPQWSETTRRRLRS